MKIICCFGEHSYGLKERGLGVENEAFIPALKSLGHEVYLFDTWIKGVYSSYSELNVNFVNFVSMISPDLIITVVADVELWVDSLIHLQNKFNKLIIISWTTDDTWKYNKVSKYIGRYYHGMLTTYSNILNKYKNDGIDNVKLTQWAANEKWLREPLSHVNCKYKISFVGIAYGDREKIVKELGARGIVVDCFGYKWPSGPITSERIPEIFRDSVITLNFSKGLYGGENQIKARNFEVPGSGGFLLTEFAFGLEKYFDLGEEIITWNTIDDLSAKIKYYLLNGDERDRMALRAHQRVRENHLYTMRFSDVIEWAKNLKLKPNENHKILFDDIVRRHTNPWYFKAIKYLLICLCGIIWGNDKKERYARRIALEISLIISGENTFMARGWFGRMFPPIKIMR